MHAAVAGALLAALRLPPAAYLLLAVVLCSMCRLALPSRLGSAALLAGSRPPAALQHQPTWVLPTCQPACFGLVGLSACLTALASWPPCLQECPEWQAVLGPCRQRPPAMPIPPSRMNPSRLLRALSSKGSLPASELQPLLKLARGLQEPPGHVGAAAVALAVGWAEARGRAACVDALTLAVQELGVRVVPADVWEQRAKLQQRWGVSGSHAEGACRLQLWHGLLRFPFLVHSSF